MRRTTTFDRSSDWEELSSGRFLPRLGPLGNRRSFFAQFDSGKKKRTPSASAFLLPDLGNAWLDPMSLTHVGVDSLHEFGLRQKVHCKKILPLLALGINARNQSITQIKLQNRNTSLIWMALTHFTIDQRAVWDHIFHTPSPWAFPPWLEPLHPSGSFFMCLRD